MRGRSPLASLSIILKKNIVAILYNILDIGGRSHLWLVCYRNFVAISPHCYILSISLRLIIPKILRAKSSLSSLSPLRYSNIIALFYKKLDIGSQLILV